MKDYIYPLHNVTQGIALGEERSVRMDSPTPASGLLLQQDGEKKHFFLVQLLIIRTNRVDVSVLTNVLFAKYCIHTSICITLPRC